MPADYKIPIIHRSPHPLPAYQTPGAAAMDLCAFLGQPRTLLPQERNLIPTGLFVALPEGLEGQVRPRSGLACNHGITVLNSPGTIDADYRGELKVLLVNLSKNPFCIKDGMRIAQLIIAPCLQVRWNVVAQLPKSVRGTQGFGSTKLT